MDFILVVVGMVFLVLGAQRFVMGASLLAKKFKVSPLVIGLSVVAFGTSAPELAVSIQAGISGSNEIVVGNVIGSNIFNLLIVAGCSCLISPLLIEKDLLKRDWPISIIGSVLLFILVIFDNSISRLDGFILLLGFVFVLLMQITSALKNKEEVSIQIHNQSIFMMILNIILGLTLIILGGNFSVDGAIGIAKLFNVSQTIIGLTIVAIGTSLPELVTSLVATKEGEKSIAIGNVIGSNVFNILFILGISCVVNPIDITYFGIIDLVILIIISAILFIPAKLNKFKYYIGIPSILSYIIYTIYIIVR